MAWKCRECGEANWVDKWEKCENCGAVRRRDLEELEESERLVEYQKIISNFIITTTPSIESCIIRNYFGIISSVVVLGTGFLSDIDAEVADFWGSRSTVLQQKLDQATEYVISELLDKALKRNAEVNALVGLKIDYSIGAKNILFLCSTATAVHYEKIQISIN